MTSQRTAPSAALAILALLILPSGAAGAVGPGDVIPFFKATDLQGRSVAIGELVARKRLAILFWDWRRATSTRAMQALDRLQAAYPDRGLAVIAVEGEGTAAEQVADRVEKLRAIGILQRYTIVPDPGGRLARQFRVDSTPQIFLVDGAGRVFEHLADFRAEDETRLEERVKVLLGLATPLPARQERVLPAPAAPAAPVVPAAPEDPDAVQREKYWYFGNYHLNKGEAEKAEEYFRKVVEIAPEDVEAWLHIGEACARQGRYDQAREAWERVLRIAPGNAEADASIRRLIRGEY